MVTISPAYLASEKAPSRELIPSSGIFEKKLYSTINNFAPDQVNNINPNNYVNITTTSTTLDPNNAFSYRPDINHSFVLNTPGRIYPNTLLSTADYSPFTDMSVFNNYYHYTGNINFNPQTFLEQSVVVFNIYSLEYR